jgi:hypothetical protein
VEDHLATFGSWRGEVRRSRSGAGLAGDSSGLVVPRRRCLRPATKRCSRISVAGVFFDTRQSIACRSAGDPRRAAGLLVFTEQVGDCGRQDFSLLQTW